MSSEKKISDLPPVPSLDNTALFEIEQGGVSYNVDFNTISGISLKSINADTTAAQLLTGQTNKILIADDLAGNHTFTIGTDIVTLTDAQTLTNKIVDADLNTITNIGSSEIKSELIIGQTPKATPVDADEILISDSAAAGALKKITLTALLAGVAQTPWLQDIVADGFDLNDLSNILFRSTTGAPTATDRAIWYDDAIGMRFNALTGDLFRFDVNGVSQLTINDTTIDFEGNTLTDILDITSITSLNGVAIGNYATSSDNLSFFAATTSLQLLGIMSDETGTGLLVFNDTPIIITPTIASFVNATHSHLNAAGGGTITKASISDTPWTKADLPATTVYTDQANTFGAFAQRFPDAQLQLDNPAATFQYIFKTSAIITIDKDITLPLLTGNDIFVFEAHPQTLINKIMTAAANTFSGFAIGAEVTGASTDLTDTADIAYLNTANTFIAGNKNTFAHSSTTAGIAVLPVAGNPSGQADGDLWLNVTTQQLFARINGANIDLGGGGGGEVFTWTADHSANSFDLTTLGNLLMTADETHLIDITRTTAQADGYVIGEIRFRHPDGEVAPVIQNYATIVGVMVDDAIGAEDGSLKFQVTRQGVHNIDFMTLNNAANNRIELSRNLKIIKDSTNVSFFMFRNEIVADATTITSLIMRGLTDTSVEIAYAKLSTVVESDVNASFQGSFYIAVAENGVSNVKYIHFNDAGLGQIDILKPTLFADVDVIIKDNRLLIESPDGLTPVTFINAQQTLARNLTIPILTANDALAVVGLANAWADGIKQTFNPDATNAGINFGSQAGDPSTLVNGDTWYNSTTNKFRARENAASVDMIGGGGAAKSFFVSATETNNLTTTLQYINIAFFRNDANESVVAHYIPIGFTWSNLSCSVNSETADVDPTIKTRDDGANGNQVITITGTGDFEDISNTDTVAANSKVNYVYGGEPTSGLVTMLGPVTVVEI